MFFVKNARMISVVKLEKYMANASTVGIIVSKFYYKKKLFPIILFKIDQGLKIGFYCIVLLFNLAIYLKIESD